MPLLGAQLPSGRQHEIRHTHTGGPASITPASTTGSASHFPALHFSALEHFSQAWPARPHSSRDVPSTHSVLEAQQPLQVELSQGR